MHDALQNEPDALGPFRLVREAGRVVLGPGLSARRWIAIDDRVLSNHVVYALDGCRGRARVRRVMAAAEAVAEQSAAHMLPIQSVTVCPRRGVCVVTAYTGHNIGLCTVCELIAQRGAGLSVAELRRAVEHAGSALAALHQRGLVDGALCLSRLLVDRGGRIHTELCGLWAAVVGYSCNSETIRDDVRSLVRMTGEMIGRDDERVRAEFARWLADGLDPLGGYPSVAAALALLPSGHGAASEEPRIGVIRGLLDRLRGVVASR